MPFTSHRILLRTRTSSILLWLLGLLSIPMFSHPACAVPHYMVGTFTGTVNGNSLNMNATITLDYSTGHVHAEVSPVPASIAGGFKPVTSLVTVGGATCALPIRNAENMSSLVKTGFTRYTPARFVSSGDTLGIVHTATVTGGDTVFFTATVNGTVPPIPSSADVRIGNFHDNWTQTGPGEISFVGSTVFRIGAGGSGDTLVHGGRFDNPDLNSLPFPEVRHAFNMTVAYDAGQQKLTYEQYNTISPLDSVPAVSPPIVVSLGILLGGTALYFVRRSRTRGLS